MSQSAGKQHVVAQGESVESIAFSAGHRWETVWDAPENAELRELRKNPHVLFPGDVVFVPPLERREESLATGRRHRIRRSGVPSKLEVRFLVDGEPRANAAYTIVIDGEERSGTTDGDGWLRESVHPLARQAEVRFAYEVEPDPDFDPEPADDDADHEGDRPEDEAAEGAPEEQVFRFDLRHMDPVTELSGAQARLHLLGYHVGPLVAGGSSDEQVELPELTRQALCAFQADHELEVSGELDDATRAKLSEYSHG